MHRLRPVFAAASVAVVLLLSGCGEERGNRKATFPVTGEVYVDGQPVEALSVKLHNVAGLDKENPTTSFAYTDDSGKFEVSTYEKGDGVPPGEYVLTFRWGQMNMMTMQYAGDKFGGRYLDPSQSNVAVTVREGEPTDLGRIDLTTR